jgi:hypothetical protein
VAKEVGYFCITCGLISSLISFLLGTLLYHFHPYTCNVCFDTGEYESMTLDCPLFKKRIVVEESEIVLDKSDVSRAEGGRKMRIKAKRVPEVIPSLRIYVFIVMSSMRCQ